MLVGSIFFNSFHTNSHNHSTRIFFFLNAVDKHLIQSCDFERTKKSEKKKNARYILCAKILSTITNCFFFIGNSTN